MPNYQWLHDLVRLHNDAANGTWSQQKAFRAAVIEHANALVFGLYEKVTEKPKPKPLTINDNYPAGFIDEPTDTEIELHEQVEELEAEIAKLRSDAGVTWSGYRGQRKTEDKSDVGSDD